MKGTMRLIYLLNYKVTAYLVFCTDT